MKRMLINATQPEERRLAIVDGQKLLDFESELESCEQCKSNIYKAVVTRVEPSLEACFVDYGEDRHGFLPFKEISKQYFQNAGTSEQYTIQEQIKEGQPLLAQIEKEKRGNKGAALTTFISLAGRYVVLMPNNPNGGGVSRRIEGNERAQIKENLDQLEYPKGMSIIARTAGIGRNTQELQWDLNYLLKLWQAIEAAQNTKGAFLIYKESSLVIRAMRDYFNTDIGDILIDADDIYEQAKQFMGYVMPEYASRIKCYREDTPLFSRFQIEHQIESAYSRIVELPSGGSIVIDHTEALAAVDVNSARAIKGSHIEDTALRTNLEAVDEIARQMRLRDLGGLLVIDFIDMEENKNRRETEQRLREALRQDRARIQFGAISRFGLLELSRQRLRPALSEGISIPCPRCGGSGHIRDTESSALQILRIIQEEAMKDGTSAIHVQVPVEVASFLLNEKRTEITKIELQQRLDVVMVPNKQLETPNYHLERLKYDDPCLESLGSSYQIAETAKENTAIVRHSKGIVKKQEPIIKGILPDAPAPTPTRSSPTQSSATALAPKTKSGFLPWIKNLLGIGKTSLAPTPVPGADKAPSRNERNRQARQTRSNTTPKAEKQPFNNRNPTRNNSSTNANASAAESNSNTEQRLRRRNTGPRAKRGGAKTDNGMQTFNHASAKSADPISETAIATGSAAADTRQHFKPDRAESATIATFERESDTMKQPVEALQSHPEKSMQTPGTQEPTHPESQVNQVPDTNDLELNRKTRDRYGRDRRGRRAKDTSTQTLPAQEVKPTNNLAPVPHPTTSAQPIVVAPNGDLSTTPATAPSIESNARSTAGALAADSPTALDDKGGPGGGKPSPSQSSLIYELPTQDLMRLVSTSGLQWVQSDPEKVALAQNQITQQATATPYTRSPRPSVTVDTRPLILVETRKDLRETLTRTQ